jgi:putative SOS response-associated peptidase YedK
VAPWSKNEDEARKSQSRAINARRESIHEKPTFRDSFRSKRCLIPADGYYEWATEIGQFPSKQPFYIHRADGRSLFFAGIWASWSLPASQNSPQLKIESAAVITREAVSPLAQIHHRMPLLLTPDRYLSWLNRSQAVRLEIMEQSEPAAGLSAYPVSTAVNKAAASGPGLRHPIDLGELARAHDQLLF